MGGSIPESLIQRIRESQDIVEIISGYLSLKKTGQNYTGLCPFHSEKTPSFTVSSVKQLFHCFGCGAGGDVFHFLMRHDHLTFPEAVRFLAQRSGIPVVEEKGRSGDESEKQAAVFRCNQAAAGYYHQILLSGKEGERGREYLRKRGVRPETIESFQVGFAPEEWEGLLRHLLSRGFRPEELVRAGLVAARERGTGYYDRFRGRVLFPILDLQKRIVGFGGRVVDPPHPSGESGAGPGPKYLNSPETPVFQKGHCLFGLEKAREGIREYGWVAVSEGYMDVLTAHQAGLTNVVATLGTALTSDHVALLRRFTREVVLTFDADPAGVKAALRGWETIAGQGLRVRVLTLPAGEDPDSFIRDHGREPFLERVGTAPELIDFLLGEKIGTTPAPSIQRRVEAAEECLAVLRKVSNPIERNLYIRKVSERLEISESLLASQLEGGRGKLKAIPPVGSGGEKGQPGSEGKKGPVSPRVKAEETLVVLLLQHKDYRRKTRAVIRPEELTDPQLGAMIRMMFDPAMEEKEPVELLESLREVPWNERLAGLVFSGMDGETVEKAWRDTVATLQRYRIEEEMVRVSKELGDAETSGSPERLRELLEARQRLALRKKGLYESY